LLPDGRPDVTLFESLLPLPPAGFFAPPGIAPLALPLPPPDTPLVIIRTPQTAVVAPRNRGGRCMAPLHDTANDAPVKNFLRPAVGTAKDPAQRRRAGFLDPVFR